jgi:hypothetical protein
MIYITLPIQPPDGSAGSANAFCIRIRKGYENDEGLRHHETDGHVWEWWIITLISAIILSGIAYATQLYGLSQLFWALPAASLFIQPLLYAFSKRYRLWSETRAYKIQLKYPVDGESDPNYYRDKYAGFIANKYGLSISKEEALRLLS